MQKADAHAVVSVCFLFRCGGGHPPGSFFVRLSLFGAVVGQGGQDHGQAQGGVEEEQPVLQPTGEDDGRAAGGQQRHPHPFPAAGDLPFAVHPVDLPVQAHIEQVADGNGDLGDIAVGQ